jgi:hypothetical protein
MKKHIIQISIALFAIGILLGCDDHEEFPGNQIGIRVDFDSTQMHVLVSDQQQIITIRFDKPAAQNGSIILSVSNAQQSRFLVEPELNDGRLTLDIARGQALTAFRISPINNSTMDGDFEFEFTLVSASPGFTIGEKESISVKLTDDDLHTPGQATANFIVADKRLDETSNVGKILTIQFSEALTAPGSIELSIESENAIYGAHFITEPAAIAGKLVLNAATDQTTIQIEVLPINNSIITGELELALNITNTTGSIVAGNNLSQSVAIVDDELTNKPKGYEIGGGGWSLKKTYQYDELGRVLYVHNEKSTPATSSNTETYFYNAAGKIQKINTHPGIDVLFTWASDKITKSETVDHGVLKQYTEFDYDEQGNISGAANYFRQPDGQLKLAFLNLYLYFLDGNLHKSMTYIPGNGPEEYALISTKTYDGYLAKANPFPMVEILPTTRTQTKLPSSYLVEENGITLRYNFTYEYRADGLVTKRIARSGILTETAHYQYY